MNSNTVDKQEIKVTVHCVPHVTRAGYQCLKHARFFVAAGANPRGPRNGRCGVIVDGEQVSDLFSRKEKAWAVARAYALENDAVLDI